MASGIGVIMAASGMRHQAGAVWRFNDVVTGLVGFWFGVIMAPRLASAAPQPARVASGMASLE
jgi:hypothetical protein